MVRIPAADDAAQGADDDREKGPMEQSRRGAIATEHLRDELVLASQDLLAHRAELATGMGAEPQHGISPDARTAQV